MVTGARQRDPRSIITPDAFDVDAALVGTPLASPSRRAVALLVDLAVIGFITLVTKSFALIVGVIAAAALVRAGFKRTPVRGSVFGRAMRLSVGCLGIVVALVTALIWVTVSSDVLGRLANSEPAREAAMAGLEALDDSTADEIRAALDEAGLAGALDLATGTPDGPLSAGDSARAETRARELDDLTLAEVVAAYSRLLAEDPGSGRDDGRLAALEARIAAAVARDTIGALESALAEREGALAGEQQEHEATRARLSAATAPGLFGRLRDFADELGFGFSWAILYTTILLSWWNGQTVGKKLLGLRVVRLDGEPITWWIAFERAGGYAAGFATGLLGFAQVWWDANRQAIHDRIVGTVVIREGAARVADWESAL